MEPRVEPTTEILLGKYQLGRLLGRGSFAKVYFARSLTDGKAVAIKVIDKTKTLKSSMAPHIIREVSAMQRLHHPNIVKIHEVMATKSKIYLVMDYAKGGELFTKISRRGRLSESAARQYFQQLISALHFCHINGVAHRDIKPQNLLLDHEGNLKVSDFGLSALPEQLKDGLLHTACGTPAYAAPEVVGRKGYDGGKADAWSCGVILFVFLAGFHPFDDSNLAEMYRKMHRKQYQFPSWFSKPVKSLISRLLDPNPETRLSIEALMEVAWFKKSLISSSITTFGFETMSPKEEQVALPLNAFDIISLSSGLDLSGLFEVRKKKERRFTSSMESPEEILNRVTGVGRKLGYNVGKRKDRVVGLEKGRMGFLIEVLEVAPMLFLVEVKEIGSEGAEFEEVCWRDLKVELEDMVVEWHNDAM